MKKSAYLLIFALALFSCKKDCIEQSGREITDIKEITGFTAINCEGDFDVIIDTGPYEVSVVADRAFIPYIELNETGGTLNMYVNDDRCLEGPRPLIHIFAPADAIESIALLSNGDIECNYLNIEVIDVYNEGSGNIILNNLNTYDTYAEVSGSGMIKLNGTGVNAEYILSGSGIIDGINFSVDDGIVSVPGSGEVHIDAYDRLDINISGSGAVYYRSPRTLNYDISGSGEIFLVD